MQEVIKIPKGLDVPLFGKATGEPKQISSSLYALKPLDCIGVTPKLLVDVGDKVKIGSPIYYIKQNPQVKFTSTVSGTVKEIRRGDKRVIMEIIIESDGKEDFVDFSSSALSELSNEQIKQKLLDAGLWTFIRQRPYSIIPSVEDKPKYVIIKGFDSAPLALDYNIVAKGQKDALQVGVDALKKMLDVPLYLCLNKQTTQEELKTLSNVKTLVFEGKHPYGNVSVLSSRIGILNKGERIWYIDLQDLLAIGKLFLEGKYYSKKIIAFCGQEVLQPSYYVVNRGCDISPMAKDNVNTQHHLRFISGNVLTGTRIEQNGFLSYYDNQVTVIEEGDYREGLGWMKPELKRFSISRTFLKGFTAFCSKKPVKIDSNLHGSKRAYVFTGNFEKVLPLDIYPMQLIKACLVEDIDKMEELGIYEVDSEDFALCEVIDVSKTDIQQIVAQGLELMRKEGL